MSKGLRLHGDLEAVTGVHRRELSGAIEVARSQGLLSDGEATICKSIARKANLAKHRKFDIQDQADRAAGHSAFIECASGS